MYRRFWKRCIDVFGSVCALLVLGPLILVLAFLVRFNLGAPIFFKQTRPGLGGVPFEMIKFRTMTDERDTDGALLSDNARLTRLGRFLRMTSLDELPEFFNVLKGDMSLVGPRPLLMEYMDVYRDAERARHDVRPGITGLAQVNGRNNLLWEERFQYDLLYVEKLSFVLDLRILLKTIFNVLKRDGVLSVPGEAQKPLTFYRQKQSEESRDED